MRVYRTVIRPRLTFLLAALLIACTSPTSDAPAEAAEDWLIALATQEAMEVDNMTCLGLREEVRDELMIGSTLMTLGQMFFGNLEVTVNTSDVDFKTIRTGDQWAVVSVNGEMRLNTQGNIQSEDLGELWFMVNNGENWQWCGKVEKSPMDDWESVDLIRQLVLLRLNSIESYRGASISVRTEIETGRDFPPETWMEEHSLPSRHYYVSSNEGGKGENYQVLDTECTRSNDDPWSCRQIFWDNSVVHMWPEIVNGHIASDTVSVVDSAYEQITLDGIDCHLFSIALKFTDFPETGEQRQLCIERDSLLPRLERLNGRNDTHLVSSEIEYSDFNEEISIELPN